MKKILLIFTAAHFVALSYAQNEFYNRGAEVYVQKGALIHVQGEVVNDNGSTTGIFYNDGVIEVKTNFENKTGSEFKVGTDATSLDRAVKFIGSGDQSIKGNMAIAGTATFHNLVVDKVNATDKVLMDNNVTVTGSLVFNNSTSSPVTTTTYSPVSHYTTNGNRGIVQTYVTGGTEYLLFVNNTNQDAIKGHAAFNMSTDPNSGYVLTKGTIGSSAGGLQRSIPSISSSTPVNYDYPVATVAHRYNPVRLGFFNTPGGGTVKGKFCDGTNNPAGYVGTISQHCAAGCGNPMYSVPDNNGYNRFFPTNACNGGSPQWYILESAVKDHGFWSFSSSNTGYNYIIEVFPNNGAGNYTLEGSTMDTWRTIKKNGAYGDDPSGGGVDWRPEIENVSNITDLLTYSLNTNCYSGLGVPGGVYTDFSHFAMSKAKSNNALPVELLYLKAEPVQNTFIKVSWATTLEINNMGFEVQRSTDAINWQNIGWVDGNGNTTVQQNYFFDDYNVVKNIVYYYRLRQVDFDGQYEYTYVVSAMLNENGTIQVLDFMPNPTLDQTYLAISAAQPTSIDVEFYNAIGQKVLAGRYDLQPGINKLPFNLSNLAAGTYNSLITTENKVFSKKVVLTR